MKNNKGFTLVEIIISIALLGIISTMMLPAMTAQFRLITRTRAITEDVAEAQQVMEVEISDVKKDVQNGITPDGRTSYKIFEGDPDCERTVYGYPRIADVSLGNHIQSLFTIIADNRMEEFPVAAASVTIEFSDGSDTLDYAYVGNPSIYVASNLTLNDPLHVNLTSIYRWYVSRPGFNIPMITDPLEIEKGSKYPIFPDDYSIIPGQSGTTLTNITDAYSGKHIICTVTPASNSGKMGATAVSNPVFVCGLPVIDDMELHLDASMISKNDSNATDGLKAKKWYHIQGDGKLLSTSEKHAVQGISSKQPELIEEKIGNFEYNHLEYETYAKFLRFDGSDDFMDAKMSNSFSMGDKSVFIVARDTGTSSYTIFDNSTGYPANLLTINGTNKKVYIGYDGGSDYSAVDIAEIIIYSPALSASKANQVHQYLQDKYQPVAPVVSIYSLHPVTATAVRGSVFSMPSTVPANMSNGTIKDVAVTWSPSSIDTSTVGWKTSIGTAVANTTKTTTLSVNVTTISSLDNLHEYVEQYEDYILPTTVPARLNNGEIADVAVTWSVSDVDTSILGDVTVTGTAVLDSTKTVTLVVSVVPVAVDTVTLNKESTTIVRGGTETLIATVAPSNASNKAVIWHTSDASVATVGSNGLVTAVGAGTATITVTSVANSSLYDTCTVSVNIPVTGITVEPTSKTVPKGGSTTLVATVYPSDALNKNITWSSSNTTYVTVNSSGVVNVSNSATNGRTYTITAATVDGGFTATCTITVGRPVTGVTLDESSIYLDPGARQDLYATVLPNNATTKGVTWESSNTAVATVSTSGRVTAVGMGTATITVTTVDGGFTDTCTVTVGRPVTGVALGESSMSIDQGDEDYVLVTFSPSNATNKGISWTTSNASVATVQTYTSGGSIYGRISAVGVGTAVIRVITAEGGFTDTCTITVPWEATDIEGERSWFTLTFNTAMKSASMSGTTCTASGNTITCTRNSGNFSNNTDYSITVKASDDSTKVITVNRSGFIFYSWEIVDQ